MTPFPFWNTYSPAGVCLLKSRPSIAALLALELLYGCHDPGAHRPSEIVLVPERTPSFEIAMTANLGSNPRVGTTLEITLRNVGQRTLVFNTGLQRYPMANFAFSFELPTREWLQISCQLCSPASADQPSPYAIRLSPSQFLRFTLTPVDLRRSRSTHRNQHRHANPPRLNTYRIAGAHSTQCREEGLARLRQHLCPLP